MERRKKINQIKFKIGNICLENKLPKKNIYNKFIENISFKLFLEVFQEEENEENEEEGKNFYLNKNELLLKVHRVIFLFPDSYYPFKFIKNMSPFIENFQTNCDININILIYLEDGSKHQFNYQPRINLVYFIIYYYCYFDIIIILFDIIQLL